MFEPAPLYPVNRSHLARLTDRVGIMQHAVGRQPDPTHGYCTDDVARALIVDLDHGGALGWTTVAASAGRSLDFLQAAFAPATGRFRNFRSVTGEWLEAIGSEDSHARAELALANASVAAGTPAFRAAARRLFERALPAGLQLTYLRPLAATLLACDVAATGGSRAAADALPELANAVWLATRTDRPVTADWPWPEPVLTYENGIVPQALIRAGDRLGDTRMVDRGLALLDWLIVVQTADAGHFSPIGNRGWWPRGGRPARYDQQPMEATALLLAAEAAFQASGDPRHRATMEWVYAWFLGRNDAHRPVALPYEGAGQDGLTTSGVNTNQGAESTLMWLLALERIRAVRRFAGVGASLPADAMRTEMAPA
jgi:hypothetical protein